MTRDIWSTGAPESRMEKKRQGAPALRWGADDAVYASKFFSGIVLA
jgi:hypothetical protein